jgi:chromosome segregation ATPase
VLSEEVEPTAFDALAGMTLAAPKPRQNQGRKPEPTRERKRGRVEELEGKLAEATKALRQAERELRKAENALERASRRVAQLASRLKDAQ